MANKCSFLPPSVGTPFQRRLFIAFFADNRPFLDDQESDVIMHYIPRGASEARVKVSMEIVDDLEFMKFVASWGKPKPKHVDNRAENLQKVLATGAWGNKGTNNKQK